MSTRRPRYRYVVFRLEGARLFRREEVLEALRATSPPLWLVNFAGTSGLVRTTNTEKDAAIRALNGIDVMAGERVRVRTVGTSGTIRAATEKYLRPKGDVRREQEKNPYK
ncbi:MAG: Rpp14/Pop5 family protein [Thermoplasmata archaeon]